MNVFIVHFLGNLADIKGVVAYTLKVAYAVEHSRYAVSRIFGLLIIA